MISLYSFSQKIKNTFVLLIIGLLVCPTITKSQVDYQIGNGTGGGCSSYPTPFGDYFKSDREQFLFLASELTAAGMSAGVITAIKWNVNNTCGSAPLTDYTIKIGTTNVTSMTGWVTGISTTVYGPSTYTMTSGLNTFTLPTPFVWNGTDNIIIETCHNNLANASYTYNGHVYTHSTSFTSTYMGYSDITLWCGNNNSYTSTPNRPNTIFTYGLPCTGAPTTEITGPNEVCPNVPFTLGFTQFWSGISVQWQTSANGTSWTNWGGPVTSGSNSITDAITAPKWYRAIVTCISNNQTYTTQPHYVAIAPFYYCYCGGSKANSSAGIDVGNVKVITLPGNEVLLDNGNASPFLSNAAANKTYTSFQHTVPPIPMYHDSSYRFLLSQTSSSASFTAAMATIFIDYNRNGTFDTFERILLEPTTNSLPFPGLVTDTFKIPDSAGYGLTGMRVILRAGNTSPDSCLAYGDGETEDYLVELRHDPCAGTPTAGVIVGDTSMCVGYEYTLTDSTYQKSRHGLVHSWQRSADAVSWVDIPNSTGKDSIQRLFTGQPLHYRVRMICTATDDTSFSPVHKVNIKPNYKCYCFSQSTGKQNDTSDIGGLEIGPYNYTDGGSHLNNPRAWRPRTDHTDLAPIELIMDSLYEFYIYHTQFNNNHGDGKITVFMDFDNDTKYDIPDERVYTGFTNVGYHTLVSKMQVAEYAIVDVPTGMRVIVNNDVAPNTPSDEACGTYTSGETEDYMVIFRKWPTKVKELTSIEDVDLYPNPTGGRFMVSLKSSSAKDIQVKVSGVTGQQVQVKHYSHQGGRFAEEIDLSSEAKGIYFVEIEAGGEKFVKKLVVR